MFKQIDRLIDRWDGKAPPLRTPVQELKSIAANIAARAAEPAHILITGVLPIEELEALYEQLLPLLKTMERTVQSCANPVYYGDAMELLMQCTHVVLVAKPGTSRGELHRLMLTVQEAKKDLLGYIWIQ